MRAILSLLWIATLAVCSGATEPGATNQAASDTNPGVPLQSKQPQTFAELLAVPPADLESVDIARINLLCAEGLRGSEQLDVQQCLETLEAWAGDGSQLPSLR